MTRQFIEKKLVIASHNKGKIVELKSLFKRLGVEIFGGNDFNLEEPEETGRTFLENSAIKSHYFAEKTGLPSLADDSGLVIPILDGAPGIYSARWGGEEKDFNKAMNRVKDEILKLIPDKKSDPLDNLMPEAYFVCALSLTWPDGETEQFEGSVSGSLTWPPRGDVGFGYDPIFIPFPYSITFGEMNPKEKDKISHRFNAFEKLIANCFKNTKKAY